MLPGSPPTIARPIVATLFGNFPVQRQCDRFGSRARRARGCPRLLLPRRHGRRCRPRRFSGRSPGPRKARAFRRSRRATAGRFRINRGLSASMRISSRSSRCIAGSASSPSSIRPAGHSIITGSRPARGAAGRRNCSISTTQSVTGSAGTRATARPRRQVSQVRASDIAPSKWRWRNVIRSTAKRPDQARRWSSMTTSGCVGIGAGVRLSMLAVYTIGSEGRTACKKSSSTARWPGLA